MYYMLMMLRKVFLFLCLFSQQTRMLCLSALLGGSEVEGAEIWESEEAVTGLGLVAVSKSHVYKVVNWWQLNDS